MSTRTLGVGLLASLLLLAGTGFGAGRAYRDRFEPHWLTNATQFWYRVNTASNRSEFVAVDAVQGTRRPAFDPERLAKALSAAGLTNARPEALPLENIEFAPDFGSVQFRAGGKAWQCDLTSYALHFQPLTNAGTLSSRLDEADQPRRSARTGPETSLTFVNRTGAEVQLCWLDAEGEQHDYGKLAAGASREQHTFAGHVWVVTDANGRRLAVFEAEEAAATAEITDAPAAARTGADRPQRARRANAPQAISPDGRWRVVVKDANLVLRHIESGRETPLSRDGRPDAAYSERAFWSPDSRKVVALRTRQGDDRKVYLIESSPKDQLQPRLLSYDYLKPGDRVPVPEPHLFNNLFDAQTGCEVEVETNLFPNPWSITDVHWSPDSSRFTFLYNERGHQVLRLVAVDAQSGKTQAIIEEKSATFIDYSGKLFCEYLDDTSEILWMSERDGWNHLYLFDAQTGALKHQITRGDWVVRGVDRVDKQQRQIWFRAGGIRPGQDPYYLHFCRVNFDGTGLVVLTQGDGNHATRFSPDRRFFIDTWSRVDLAPVNELRSSADGRLVCLLEQGDDTELRAGGWRPPERLVAKGRDGQTDIYGIIHWPKGFSPEHKYPVIESIYAGPQGAFVPKTFQSTYNQQKLTERGFVVVQIDGMGTSYRSKKFHDVCWKNLGDAGFPDRILWLKAAAAKHAALDLSRVGIYGTSAGGQSALRGLLAHGDFYKAGVADCGCHDNRMDKIWWNEQWMGWPIGPEYEQQSNVTQAGRLQGKLLLIVGELDKNVDPASTMQVVNALIKADKDFELLVMPGAGHGVLGTPYGQRRLVDFFVRNLL